jgi:ABC-type multidrug transport system fused ATPase/permease subunit
LDSDEILELEARPDEKIMVMWFLTKTIGYSIATMFFVFTIMFFISTFSLVSDVEDVEGSQAGIVQDSVTADNTECSDDCDKTKLRHPFWMVADYWEWALALVCATAVLIQIYLIYLRRTYRYIVTNRRCMFVGGILKRIERSVPYKKITDIQRSQNIVERMLGIWNVQVFTPGTASMQIGQAKARAELNFDGLMNSEEMYAAINKHTQLNG